MISSGKGDEAMKQLGWILLFMGLAGCVGGTRAVPTVRQYVLDYPAPRVESRSTVKELLRVERFAAARLYAGSEMVVSRGAYRRDDYQQHRWRANPADLVTDFLKRDLRQAGLFQAVLGARDAEETRFVLAGEVTEFVEIDEGKNRRAALAATLTLSDLTCSDISCRVLFQKAYRCEAPFTGEGATGYAEAMSRAMAQFSAQLITDIDRAIMRGGR
jgi:ABC-type uncharacterized transport system auxiliary subunit